MEEVETNAAEAKRVIPAGEDFGRQERSSRIDRLSLRAAYVVIGFGFVMTIVMSFVTSFGTGGIDTLTTLLVVVLILLIPQIIRDARKEKRRSQSPEHLEDVVSLARVRSLNWQTKEAAKIYADSDDPAAKALVADLEAVTTATHNLAIHMGARVKIIDAARKPQ